MVFLCELARGSMGETRASGEGILGGFWGKGARCAEDDYLLTAKNFSYLNSFNANKLKYVHGEAFGYKICKLNMILEEALMTKTIKGEPNYGF